MKLIIKLSLLLFFVNLNTVQAEKYGLVIAIGKYPQAGGWNPISSHNDVVHVTGALRLQGFKDQNIVLLQDENAKRAHIIDALNAMKSKLTKGDIVFIHFSGHGQQVLDDNGDELDNLDEAIVPYDSPLTYIEGVYEGQNLIRDDLIGEITAQMRVNCGADGQVILVLDSCHSGSGTRGLAKTRGTDKIMAPEGYKNQKYVAEKQMGIIQELGDDVAPMASFFGASSRELNYETMDDQSRPVGSLSYSFYSVLSSMKNTASFSEIFDRVRLKMKSVAPYQNPQWEGPEQVMFLSGEGGVQSFLFNVNKIVDERTIIAEMGTIAGVFKGSKIELVSLDRDSKISSGLVVTSSLNSSTISLDEPVNISKNELVKVKLLEKAIAPVTCKIQNDLKTSSEWIGIVNRVLDNDALIQVDENAELFLKEAKNKTLLLQSMDGSILFEKSIHDPEKQYTEIEFRNAISNFTKAKYLRSYETFSSPYLFEVTLQELDANDNDKVIRTIMPGDKESVKIGSSIRFKVENIGEKGAYFSLLDIQPDNLINLVIPAVDYGYTASEYYLEPGESYVTDYPVIIYEPIGDETLKLISSSKPLDLSGFIRTNSSASRGIDSSHSFESFISDNSSGSRGAKPKAGNKSNFGVTSLYFEIIE